MSRRNKSSEWNIFLHEWSLERREQDDVSRCHANAVSNTNWTVGDYLFHTGHGEGTMSGSEGFWAGSARAEHAGGVVASGGTPEDLGAGREEALPETPEDQRGAAERADRPTAAHCGLHPKGAPDKTTGAETLRPER